MAVTGMQAQPTIPLRKSNSMGSLPSNLVMDEHADHGSGFSGSGCSLPGSGAKFVCSLPQDHFGANLFKRHPGVCSSHRAADICWAIWLQQLF